MQEAGCEAIDDLTDHSAMLIGAIGLVRRAYRLMGKVSRALTADDADLAILVDSPALHLPMAKRIRKAGVPVLYYIAPQIWAWAPWRIRRIRKRVDRLAAILPFEEEYFRSRGVDATFVGHPLVEQLAATAPDQGKVNTLKAAGKPIITCMPGSRRQVIAEVLPGQIQVARAIAQRHPNSVFLFSSASDQATQMISEKLAGESFNWQMAHGCNAEFLSVSDLVLVASGTASLEVAQYGVPMVVMYNHSKWGYRLVGQWVIQTPYLCLVNILANKVIVPEIMPYYDSIEPIADEALDLLENEQRRATMQADLAGVVRSLGTSNAAATTARMAMEMIANHKA